MSSLEADYLYDKCSLLEAMDAKRERAKNEIRKRERERETETES